MHRIRWSALVFLVSMLSFPVAQTARAGGGPENVLLVVNAEDETSRMIANWYQRLRNIPDSNVLFLTRIPRSHAASFEQGKDLILRPILEAIENRKLGGQIDYVVYSTGFPTTVMVDEHSKKFVADLVARQGGDAKNLARMFRGRASLTSFTYFAVSIVNDDASYLSPSANNYYRMPIGLLMERPFVGQALKDYENAVQSIRDGDGPNAVTLLQPLADSNPLQMVAHYRLAQAWAIQEDVTQTSRALTNAVRAGWCYREYTKTDLMLKKIIDQPLIKGFVDRIPDEPYEFVPTVGCNSRFRWGPGGGINNQNDQGIPYLLSTMLGTNWNRGNSEKEILQYLNRSVRADYSQPKGKFYFAETRDVRSRTRRPNFQAAIDRLKGIGIEAEICNTALPRDSDVAGAMIGTPSYSWQTSGCNILPGSICENLTSYGGEFNQPAQTKLTELLRFGAAGSSGTVCEPFAEQFKFPHPMIHVHYVRGCSLAEAFYQSLSGPFQLLIVGDALCQPWARPPVFQIDGIQRDQVVKGNVMINIKPVEGKLAPLAIEVYFDGRLATRQSPDRPVQFDSTKMSDGYHELRIVGIESSPIQTRSSSAIPIWIDNLGLEVKLETDQAEVPIQSTLVLNVVANVGDSVEITHAGELVGKLDAAKGEIRVETVRIGRGPADLIATVKDSTGKSISSRPLKVTITGNLAETTSDLPVAKK